MQGRRTSSTYSHIEQPTDSVVGFRGGSGHHLAYENIPCIGAEVQLHFGGVKKSGNGYPSAREIIEAVTDRTAWTLNNSKEIQMA